MNEQLPLFNKTEHIPNNLGRLEFTGTRHKDKRLQAFLKRQRDWPQQVVTLSHTWELNEVVVDGIHELAYYTVPTED